MVSPARAAAAPVDTIGVQAWRARKVADEVLHELMAYSIRGEVVGSLRRGLSHVKDIDILLLPDVVKVEQHNLWNEVIDTTYTNPIPRYIEQIGWDVMKAGEKTITLMVRGIRVEVYMVFDARQWGGACVVRTGPHQVSKRLMNFALHKHWHFKDYLLHQHEKSERGYHKGGCQRGLECTMVADTREEHDIFYSLGLDYLLPEARTAERMRSLEMKALGLKEGDLWV